MTDAYATASAGLIAIIDTEFSSELITARNDKLHESRGWEGVEVGVSPIRQVPSARNELVLETFMLVQFYGVWDKQIDPTQQVDPLLITSYADRFRTRCESVQATTPGTSEVWFFSVQGIEFPDDPTGNKTRFEAIVKSWGDNTALLNR